MKVRSKRGDRVGFVPMNEADKEFADALVERALTIAETVQIEGSSKDQHKLWLQTAFRMATKAHLKARTGGP